MTDMRRKREGWGKEVRWEEGSTRSWRERKVMYERLKEVQEEKEVQECEARYKQKKNFNIYDWGKVIIILLRTLCIYMLISFKYSTRNLGLNAREKRDLRLKGRPLSMHLYFSFSRALLKHYII